MRMIVCRFGHVQARSSGDDLSLIVVSSWSQGGTFASERPMKAPNPNLISKKSKLRGLFARVQTPTNYVPVHLEWCRRAKPARKTQLKALWPRHRLWANTRATG